MGRHLIPLLATVFGLSVLAGAGAAFAQAESDTYANERDPNWRGEVTGAGNLRQCSGMTQEDRLLVLKAVYDNLDPDNYPSAEIRIMSAADLMKLEKSRMIEAGLDPEKFWTKESVNAGANLKSRIESYGNCRGFDLIVVEYKKSADKQASDKKLFKLHTEKTIAPRRVKLPPAQSPGYGAGAGTARRGNTRPSRATICQRNPQAYQCLYGVPSDNVRSDAQNTPIARAAPPLPDYLASARTPDEAAWRAIDTYVSRYLALRRAWEKASQDHSEAARGCGNEDAACKQRLAIESARHRGELMKENNAASQKLASDVQAIGEHFGMPQSWRERTLDEAWKKAAAGQG